MRMNIKKGRGEWEVRRVGHWGNQMKEEEERRGGGQVKVSLFPYLSPPLLFSPLFLSPLSSSFPHHDRHTTTTHTPFPSTFPIHIHPSTTQQPLPSSTHLPPPPPTMPLQYQSIFFSIHPNATCCFTTTTTPPTHMHFTPPTSLSPLALLHRSVSPDSFHHFIRISLQTPSSPCHLPPPPSIHATFFIVTYTLFYIY